MLEVINVFLIVQLFLAKLKTINLNNKSESRKRTLKTLENTLSSYTHSSIISTDVYARCTFSSQNETSKQQYDEKNNEQKYSF